MRSTLDLLYMVLGLAGSMAVLMFNAPVYWCGASFGICMAGITCRMFWGWGRKEGVLGTCPFVVMELSQRGHEKSACDRSPYYGHLRKSGYSPYACRWIIAVFCFITAILYSTSCGYLVYISTTHR